MNNFESLNTTDVVSVEVSIPGLPHYTFKVAELRQALLNQYGTKFSGWFAEGVNCEVLPNDQWEKGTVRISVEFCREERGEVSGDDLDKFRQ